MADLFTFCKPNFKPQKLVKFPVLVEETIVDIQMISCSPVKAL